MSESTPICRCRVLYLGSSVPQQTKDGLQGIQEPLQELYPDQGATGARGIDSWLSVWSNGILLENVDENHKKITRFFPIESLHYCAAIRYVLVPEKNTLHNPSPRFLPLDSPFARAPNPVHPPLFAAILRRTTGIKVLECHAFICKREVAANALVRCCFHAYADSSYAKQVDTNGGGGGGSIYGTLPGGTTQEPITQQQQQRNHHMKNGDEWKSRSNSGSTMTINTVGNGGGNGGGGKDDMSIYNGDENHKVWAGSQDNLDGGGIYDVYSSSTISRPNRPRQLQQPVAVPPPPIKEKAKKKGKKNGSKEDMYPLLNGHNGKANSVSGTMVKSRQMMVPHQQQHHQPPIYIMHHPQTLPNPKFVRQYGNTFSHRPRGKMLIPARPVPPPLVPMAPMAPILLPGTMPNQGKKKKSNGKVMEEPIYMPSNRALSPVASYQPISFPHEAYLMQQYATMDVRGGKSKTPKAVKNKNMMMANKKLAQSMNGLDQHQNHHQQPNGEQNGEEESPYGTGIYRKKGHLNERAFSYSIRQEHRSRSYGSLANLKFATPIPNGHNDEDHREDIKKEREIMQMVQDLDLSGDEIERSEVPRGMYEPRGAHHMQQQPAMMTNQPMMNGRNRR